jgi:hypothetical protein
MHLSWYTKIDNDDWYCTECHNFCIKGGEKCLIFGDYTFCTPCVDSLWPKIKQFFDPALRFYE